MVQLSEEMVKKYRRRIKQYEKTLNDEIDIQGFIHDGGGRRYHIGPLYVLINDIEEALKAYNWFENKFPDDWDDPIHSLSWALALYRKGDVKNASNKLIQAMLKNVYLIEHLIGQKIKRHDIWHSSNIEEPEYIDYVPKEYLEMWNNDEIDWVKHRFNSMTFQKIYKRYIEIYHELKTVRPGPKRRELLDEISRYENLNFKMEK